MIKARLYAVNIRFAHLGRSCRWRGRMYCIDDCNWFKVSFTLLL